MSCIAGVGGHVPGLVKTAKSRRPIVALDGCPMHCVKSSLAQHDVTPAIHIDLSKYGYKKRKHVDFNREDTDTAMSRVMEAINNL